MNTQELINKSEEKILKVYNRFPVIFDHGDGVHLYDNEGKEYLDFTAGIAVFALGYNNKDYNDAIKDQVDKIIHTSNLYYNEPAIMAADKLTEVSGFDKVFFTNSGAEAVEGAIKAARKYARLKDGRNDHEIIAMEHSFHGRTFGALSVTGNAHYREDFEPMIGNIRFATLNDIESVKANINEKTCAIILETVQGEGGIYPASEEFLKEIRKICDEKDILMILDEIQCGMGRTGYMYAWQKYGVKPDIMLSAKALGCGIPVGAILFNKKVAENSLVPGDHGTTYGGNPLATRAVYEVLKLYEKEKIVDHVNEVGPYLYEKLEELKEKNPHVKAHRGVGLMQGIEIDLPLKDVLNKTLEKGVVLISAGSNLIRFVPPLIIEKEDIDKMIAVLSEVLND